MHRLATDPVLIQSELQGTPLRYNRKLLVSDVDLNAKSLNLLKALKMSLFKIVAHDKDE